MPIHPPAVDILMLLPEFMSLPHEDGLDDRMVYDLRSLGYFLYRKAHPTRVQLYAKVWIMVASPSAVL